MGYDAATVAMLRGVLDEILVSETFARQQHHSAVDVAQCVLRLASQGERDAGRIKRRVLDMFLVGAAA